MSRSLPVVPLAALLAAGCADRSPTTPLADFRIGSPAAAPSVTVMSQNLYIGADVDAVLGALASPGGEDDIPALLFAIETLRKTNYPARAAAIADEIARTRPHVVGLQEVEELDIDLTALDLPVVVHLDFMEILQAELAARGLHYTVPAQVENTVVTLLNGLISLVDHDALLVDADRVTVGSADGQTFAANVGPVGGVDLTRGWVWARVTIAGESYTFVNTHTEPDLGGGSLAGLRALQITELAAFVAADDRVVMMGDFNDAPGSPMYQVLAGAGFTDVWAALRPGAIGYTCCHLPDLSDSVAAFSQRIDYVFTRGLDEPEDRLRGKVDRFGEVPADRIAGPAYPIWPSDHVGLIAALGVRP